MIDYWNQTTDKANAQGCSGVMGPSDQVLANAPSINGWTPPLIRGQKHWGENGQLDRLATQEDVDALVARSVMLDRLLTAFQGTGREFAEVRRAIGGDWLELKL